MCYNCNSTTAAIKKIHFNLTTKKQINNHQLMSRNRQKCKHNKKKYEQNKKHLIYIKPLKYLSIQINLLPQAIFDTHFVFIFSTRMRLYGQQKLEWDFFFHLFCFSFAYHATQVQVGCLFEDSILFSH